MGFLCWWELSVIWLKSLWNWDARNDQNPSLPRALALHARSRLSPSQQRHRLRGPGRLSLLAFYSEKRTTNLDSFNVLLVYPKVPVFHFFPSYLSFSHSLNNSYTPGTEPQWLCHLKGRNCRHKGGKGTFFFQKYFHLLGRFSFINSKSPFFYHFGLFLTAVSSFFLAYRKLWLPNKLPLFTCFSLLQPDSIPNHCSSDTAPRSPMITNC